LGMTGPYGRDPSQIEIRITYPKNGTGGFPLLILDRQLGSHRQIREIEQR
jgi:hypothetical protein